MGTSTYGNEITFKYVSPGEMISACTVLPALAIIFVGLRFYVRTSQRAQIGIDDWLIVPGLVKLQLPTRSNSTQYSLSQVLFVGLGMNLLVGECIPSTPMEPAKSHAVQVCENIPWHIPHLLLRIQAQRHC